MSTSVGLLEKINSTIEEAKNGTLSGEPLFEVIHSLSAQVADQSARLLSLGSLVYPKQLSEALDSLIKTQSQEPTPEAPHPQQSSLPDGELEKTEGDFS